MHSFDPQHPDVLSWIDRLSPDAELVTRLAMRAVFPQCRRDRYWRARTDALIAQVAPDVTRLARALKEAEKMKAMIRFTMKTRAA